jgi:hypothetical protein
MPGDPAAILKCGSEQDVVQGVLFAGINNLEIPVRVGGHNGAGL